MAGLGRSIDMMKAPLHLSVSILLLFVSAGCDDGTNGAEDPSKISRKFVDAIISSPEVGTNGAEDPSEISRKFVDAIISSPEVAYGLMHESDDVVTLEEFEFAARMILPPSEAVTAIEFEKVEDGWSTEVSNLGKIEFSYYYYLVHSRDRLQPLISIAVALFEHDGQYRVLRFTVNTRDEPRV